MTATPVSHAQDAVSPESALQIRGLRKSYDETVAVDSLDLDVPRGTVLALLGPNGAGKTTTVEICEGFALPDSGTVRVLGLDPVSDAGRLRPRMGVMLQGGGAYPGARAEEMLRLVAAYFAEPLDPDWLLAELGLTDVRRTSYRRLSGGQQQRLALACALVGRPEIVFLDEPTAGLDAQARRLVWDLVGRLRDDGVTVLLTTHHMEEAEQLADAIVIIDAGRVVAAGTPAELTACPDGGLEFATREPLDPGLLGAALGGRCAETAAGYRLTGVPSTPALISSLAAWCADNDVLVTELRSAGSSLEDVFLELTGRDVRR